MQKELALASERDKILIEEAVSGTDTKEVGTEDTATSNEMLDLLKVAGLSRH